MQAFSSKPFLGHPRGSFLWVLFVKNLAWNMGTLFVKKIVLRGTIGAANSLFYL
jgi:hypothetical protein